MLLKRGFKPVDKDIGAMIAANNGRAGRENKNSLTKFGGNTLTASKPPKTWVINMTAAESGFCSD